MKIRREIRDFAVLLEKHLRKQQMMPGTLECNHWHLPEAFRNVADNFAAQNDVKEETTEVVAQLMAFLLDYESGPRLYEYRFSLTKAGSYTDEKGYRVLERWTQPGYDTVRDAMGFASPKVSDWSFCPGDEGSYPYLQAKDGDTTWTITPHLYILKDEEDLAPEEEFDW